jgi:hypothetical protein
MARHREYYKGKVVASPSLGLGESCEFVFAHGSSVHQKCFSYTLTNLLFGLCTSVGIIKLLVDLPNPHLGAPTRSSTPEMLWTRERTPTLPSIVFAFGLVVESIEELRGASTMVQELMSFEYFCNYKFNKLV